MKTAQYLNSKDVRVKGHPLCWHTACADWLMKYDNSTIMKKQLERIDREVSGFKGVIDMWDVINEVVIMPIFDKYDNAITRICKDKGRIGLIKEVFERAHDNNPDAVLLLNDFNTSINYEILIDGCLNAGVPISAIGIQSHQHQGYWGKEKLMEVLDRFSSFGLPIHFTENTLISGEIMPAHIVDLNDWQVEEWPSTPEGEERQAREIEEMYRILFNHPLVEAITTWDYRDGAWLKAPSGYIRLDNSLKPSYKMLKKLVKEEWWTDTVVKTDENGTAMVEAFKGEYNISAGNVSADVKLTDDGQETNTLVLQ
jgi:GH35 family endo-1,4-beta-xylanase